MGRVSLLLCLLLSGCFVDMSGAYDLAEAKAVFDAVPTVSLGEYERGIAQQDIRRAPTGVSQPVVQQPRDIDLPTSSPSPVLGEGSPRARLNVGDSCDGLPAISGREVLIVAAFADDLPASETIFATRRYQAVLATCVEQGGGTPRFQTRVSVPGLSSPSEIVIYTS